MSSSSLVEQKFHPKQQRMPTVASVDWRSGGCRNGYAHSNTGIINSNGAGVHRLIADDAENAAKNSRSRSSAVVDLPSIEAEEYDDETVPSIDDGRTSFDGQRSIAGVLDEFDDLDQPPKLIAIDQRQLRTTTTRSEAAKRSRKRHNLNESDEASDGPPTSEKCKRSSDNHSNKSFSTAGAAADCSKQGSGNSGTPNAVALSSGIDSFDLHSSVFLPDRCRLSHVERQKNGRSPIHVSSTCWHSLLNSKLLPHLNQLEEQDFSDICHWSVEKVSDFVRSLPACPATVADRFRDELIDGEALLLLTQDDIVKLLNIRLGPAVKIHSAIMFLRHQRYKLTST